MAKKTEDINENKNLHRLITAILGGILVMLIVSLNGFYYLENILKDSFYQRTQFPSSDIVVIGIDEATIKELGNFSFWSRTETANIINILSEDKSVAPLAIGIDIMFSGKGNGDEKLVEACKNAGNVVLAKQAIFNKKVSFDRIGGRMNANSVKNFVEPFEELKKVSEQALINATLDNDAVMRRTPLYIEYNGNKLSSFSYVLAKKYADKNKIKLHNPKTDENGFFPIRYRGKMTAYYGGCSYIKVLKGEIPAERFKDKIVIIGAYSTGMGDSYQTPIERNVLMPGAEIQANIIDSIVTGDYFRDISHSLETAIIAIFTILLLWFTYKKEIKYILLVDVGIFLTYLILIFSLRNYGIRISLIYIPMVIFFSLIYFIGIHYLKEKRRKDKITVMFKQYVSPDVVDTLIKSDKLSTVDNYSKEICAMFLDIRSFTSLSENNTPENVVLMLNEYLELITEVAFKYGGMIDKFLGDGAMVLFNAPVDLEDYEMKSVKCGKEIASKCKKLSEKYERQFGREVLLGIGIHKGRAIVGNIGTTHRLDYTGIGDTINTASRLCSKAPGGEVVVSRELANTLEERIQYTYMGDLDLKGKREKFPCYIVNKIL